MHSQQHPEPEQLDRLRAGLLDDQQEAKTALEAHIASCKICQERCNWQLLSPGALGLDLDPDKLQHSLRNARGEALQSDWQRSQHGLVPYATAALLLIAVSIGIWTMQKDYGSRQDVATQDVQQIPDIYEDLDFYLWLANQEDNGNADENLDPDKT